MNNPMIWQEKLAELNDFVKANPELRLTPTSIAIPRALRPCFYELVESVQVALAGAALGELMEQGAAVAHMCGEARKQLVEKGGLNSFNLPAGLENLVAAAERALSKPVFSVVLDALQQGLATEQVLELSRAVIMPFFIDISRCAYETWAYCCVVNSLEPRRFYCVATEDAKSFSLVPTDTVTVGYQVETPDYCLPECVFETDSGGYIAMKWEAAGELAYYLSKSSHKNQGTGGNTEDLLTHRVLMLYKLDGPGDAPVLADRSKPTFLPSDLTCELLLKEELENPAIFAQIADRINRVRSKNPVELLVAGSGAEQLRLAEEFKSSMRLRAIGTSPGDFVHITKGLLTISKGEEEYV